MTLGQEILLDKIGDAISERKLKLSDAEIAEVLQHAAANFRCVTGGVVFRGWRFFAPFYCFHCGVPISYSQFCFSRVCGGCDTPLGFARMMRIRPKIFAGRVERVEGEKDDLPGCEFINPASDEGHKLSQYVLSIKPPPQHRPAPSRKPSPLRPPFT